MKWTAEYVQELNRKGCQHTADVHNDEMERVEKTIHQIAQLVTNTAGAIHNRIGELERIKHVKHY